MDLQIIEKVNIYSYPGTWYEIARLPNSFEKGLECVTATYSLKENAKTEVLNKGYSAQKKKGFDTAKVTFFWPFPVNYYIISLDEAYNHAQNIN